MFKAQAIYFEKNIENYNVEVTESDGEIFGEE